MFSITTTARMAKQKTKSYRKTVVYTVHSVGNELHLVVVNQNQKLGYSNTHIGWGEEIPFPSSQWDNKNTHGNFVPMCITVICVKTGEMCVLGEKALVRQHNKRVYTTGAYTT